MPLRARSTASRMVFSALACSDMENQPSQESDEEGLRAGEDFDPPGASEEPEELPVDLLEPPSEEPPPVWDEPLPTLDFPAESPALSRVELPAESPAEPLAESFAELSPEVFFSAEAASWSDEAAFLYSSLR